jgi:TolB-like protein
MLVIFVFLLSGCKQYSTHINKKYKTKSSLFFSNNNFKTLDKTVIEIANQLLVNIPYNTQKYNKFVLTTFVNLDKFSQTSQFGRLLAESLIDELHTRKFKILDFRTQQTILVNKNGEFTLTRDIIKLKDEIPEALIVVGTYSILNDNKIMINARIINNFTSDVVSTAKVVFRYNNCKQFNLCERIIKKKKPIVKNISRVQDDYK